jgi:hypothetical protein
LLASCSNLLWDSFLAESAWSSLLRLQLVRSASYAQCHASPAKLRGWSRSCYLALWPPPTCDNALSLQQHHLPPLSCSLASCHSAVCTVPKQNMAVTIHLDDRPHAHAVTKHKHKRTTATTAQRTALGSRKVRGANSYCFYQLRIRQLRIYLRRYAGATLAGSQQPSLWVASCAVLPPQHMHPQKTGTARHQYTSLSAKQRKHNHAQLTA